MLGDWVCHILDPAFWALKLQAPESVLAANGGEYSPERFPTESVIEWNFPAREEMPPVRVTWTYGRQTDLPQLKDVKLDDWNQSAGALLVGEKGCIVHGSPAVECAYHSRITPGAETTGRNNSRAKGIISRTDSRGRENRLQAPLSTMADH